MEMDTSKTKMSPVSRQGSFLPSKLLQQGGVDGAEGIADLGSEQTHDRDHNDGDESENNSVLNQTLTFFLGCEQHGVIPF